MSEEELNIIPDPPGNVEQDKMQQRAIQYLLNSTQFLMGSIAHELKCDLPKASTIMLSVLATTNMVFIRGYPRETWAMQFREIAEYFTRMADEATEKKGNGHDADPDS